MRIIVALFGLLLLAACASPQEEAARAAAQEAADKAECEQLGFKPRTEGFASCLLKLKEIRAQEENTRALDRSRRIPPPWPWHRYPYYDPYWP